MTLGPLMIDVQGLALTSEECTRLADPLVGGVILFARNYSDREQLRALVAAIRAARDPAPLVAVDQEGGRVQRFREGFTALPPLRWLGHIYDEDADRAHHLAFTCAWIMASELIDLGIDLSFAPCVDLDWGASTVIGDRALHADAQVVSALALSYLQGMRAAGMGAVAKHFPGHGAVVADSHHELPVDRRSRVELQEDIAPYQRLIDHGLGGVMVAHVRYPAVDAQIASLSPVWLQHELRQQLGFQGVIFTDDLSMAGAAIAGSVPERVAQALTAGADMALVCNDPQAAVATLAALRGFSLPASQRRLESLRARSGSAGAGDLRDQPRWRQATAELTTALAAAPLVRHA